MIFPKKKRAKDIQILEGNTWKKIPQAQGSIPQLYGYNFDA
jgi:hypothetical protein